jgi:hypothetical protein
MTNPFHHPIETLAQTLAQKSDQADEYLAKSAGSGPEALDAARRLRLLNEQIDQIQNAIVLLQTAPIPQPSSLNPQPSGENNVG